MEGFDHIRFRSAVDKLYGAVRDLEELFPGRPFTPDGHLVGSLGECLVANAYGLSLLAPSNEGFDATAPCGRRVEIKATQGTRVAFRSEPEHCIVIRILKDGTFEEHYNGPGDLVWQLIAHKRRPKNGQLQISLKRLNQTQKLVPQSLRLPRTSLGQNSSFRSNSSQIALKQ